MVPAMRCAGVSCKQADVYGAAGTKTWFWLQLVGISLQPCSGCYSLKLNGMSQQLQPGLHAASALA